MGGLYLYLAHKLLFLLLVLCLKCPDPGLVLHNHCLQLPGYHELRLPPQPSSNELGLPDFGVEFVNLALLLASRIRDLLAALVQHLVKHVTCDSYICESHICESYICELSRDHRENFFNPPWQSTFAYQLHLVQQLLRELPPC